MLGYDPNLDVSMLQKCGHVLGLMSAGHGMVLLIRNTIEA